MGKIGQGVYGSVSGKIGNLVGATWRGIDYLRIMPASVYNPRTPAQTNQRAKFLLALRFVQPLLGFIKIGYKGYAVGMSAYNAAMSYLLRNSVVGDFPDQAISFSDVLVSRGRLRSVDAANATSPSEATIQVSWEDNTALGDCSSDDKAILVVYNGDKASVARSLEAGARSDGLAEITVPLAYSGDTVQVYLAFSVADEHFSTGNTHTISDSVYAGEVLVT
jgi:hypothetical protein